MADETPVASAKEIDPPAPDRAVSVSIVLPARNEAAALESLLPVLRERRPDDEIIVVDDGSSDETAAVGRRHGARVISHPYGMGNGAAIKTGARAAAGRLLVLMDADGQHDPADIEPMVARLAEGHAMVVGARDAGSQASLGRRLANGLYNRLASLVTGHRIPDLTSGFRVVEMEKFREFLYLLPNGFSYPTTITMSFMRSGYPVGFHAIRAAERVGRSHIRLVSDGVRFLLIIFRISTLYSPMKLFFPASALLLATGVGYYLYTYMTEGRFTNMGALLLLTGFTVFLIGLIAEQITALMYQRR